MNYKSVCKLAIPTIGATLAAVIAFGAPSASAAVTAPVKSSTPAPFGCSQVQVSSKTKIEFCGSPILNPGSEEIANQLSGSAYVKAFTKDSSGQWKLDLSKMVSVDSVQLYLDGSTSGGIGYPSGPQAGKASSGTRGSTTLDRTVSHRAWVVAQVGVWNSTKETNSWSNLQSATTLIPADGGQPTGAVTLEDPFDSRSCSVDRTDATHLLQRCLSGGMSAAAEIFAYKWSSGQWTQDNATSVSVDTVRNFVDGLEFGGAAYPSGPQAGHARGVTRGASIPSPTQSHTAYGTAKFGVWSKSGKESKTWSLVSNLGTIPLQG